MKMAAMDGRGRHQQQQQQKTTLAKYFVIGEARGRLAEPSSSADAHGIRLPAKNAAQREAGKVPLQFGRRLAAKALECPERTHWKSCVVPKDQEAQLTESFKRVFKPYDWTLQE